MLATTLWLYPGCRRAPFYRMTRRASESLPLSREGIAAYERGDLSAAEEKLGQAFELNDCDVETCRYYGETLWERGKRVEALDVLRSAADKNGPVETQISLYRSLGEKALEVDKPDRTIFWANKIIDLAPKSPIGWELRGKGSRRLGLSEDALADFQRAAHFQVDDRILLSRIASIQNELGDYDAALASWQYLEQLYPTNREPPEIFAGKGDAYFGLNLLEQARDSFAIAARSAPNESDYQVRLARTALALGDLELVDALARNSNDPTLREYVNRARRDRLEIAEKRSDASTLR